MLRSKDRSAYVIAALALAAVALAFAVPAAAEEKADTEAKDVKASMQCDRASEPGRVRCTVELRIDGGRTIAWADVAIVSLPDFASALKGRIGPQDALARDATSTKWAFALVARRAGQGEARARVRAVVCDAVAPAGSAGPAPVPRCAPVSIDVRAPLTVGG